MKKILLTLAIAMVGYGSYAQNAPLYLWGTGLDGSTYQTTAIYSDAINGLLLEAPLSSTGTKLPITLSWRGGGSAFSINPIGNVGIGTTSPLAKFVVAGDYNNTGAGGIMLDAYPASPDQYSLRINPFVIGSGKVGYQFQTKNITGGTTIPLTFDNAGNVGIGTAGPGAKLDVINLLSGAHSTNSVLLRAVDSYNSGANGQFFQVIGAGDGTNYTNVNLISNYGYLSLGARADADATPANFLNILSTGFVGIGTTTPDAKLAVKGTIHTQEVKIDMTGWNDFVFDKTYSLPTLSSVKNYIDQKHHLPEMPAEAEVIKNGVNLGEMVKLQTKKIEELTLYLIDKDSQDKEKDAKLQSQQKQINQLKEQLTALTKSLNKN